MKAWQVTAPSTIKLVELKQDELQEDQIKVKLTKVALSRLDIEIYLGSESVAYPIIPCRQAVGIISEVGANAQGYARGQRVVIEPYTSCGFCSCCKNGKFDLCERILAVGINSDGMLRDFAVVAPNSVYHLPDHVRDTDAIYVDHVAIALNALGKLQINKGEYVAIVGAGITGTILAQAAIYYQAVPILIDDHAERLANAAELGIYYTINSSEEDVTRKLRALTGGKMCECCVHVTSAKSKISKTCDFVAYGGRLVFVGWDLKNVSENMDIAPILDKHLTVCGITNGSHLISNAINMLANRTIDVSTLVSLKVGFNDVVNVLGEAAKKPPVYNKIIVDI